MFNSCTFNTINYNSLCTRKPLGIADVRERRISRRLFRREFFPIEGIKLFHCLQLFNIIGIVLSHSIEEVEIKGQKLFKIEAYNKFYGTIQFFVQLDTSLSGKKIFKEISYVGIKGKGLMPTKQLNLINGTKLVPSLHLQLLKGSVKVPYTGNKLIQGKKDISEILKALEIIDFEE